MWFVVGVEPGRKRKVRNFKVGIAQRWLVKLVGCCC